MTSEVAEHTGESSFGESQLDALQLFQGTGPRLGFFGAEAFRHLINHRQTHSDMKRDRKKLEEIFARSTNSINGCGQGSTPPAPL